MMPTTREFLGDSLIKELEGAGFSPQSINAFAKNEYRQRKAAQEEEQRRLLYRADDMKLDGKIREALLSGEINEQEARNAQKFEEVGAKKHGWTLGAAKTVTGIANTVERVGDFINPFYEGKRDKDGNYIYQNGLEKSLRPKIKNVEKMRDDYEKATGETSWGSRLSEIGTEIVGDPINFVGGVGLLSKGSKLAQFGKKTLYFAGTGAVSGGVAALGEGKNDKETLENIGYGAVGGAFLGHAIDKGIQGISKLIAKRQASKMANEANAIDSAQNSEFLDGSNNASGDVSSDNGSLEYPNTQSIAVTIVRGVLKNEPLSTREQVLKEILSGEEKSSVIKPEKYKSILTGINEYKSYQNRLKHFHDNPDEVKNADLVFDQMQDSFIKANSGDTKKYYDAAPLFGRELKIAQTMTAKEFATKEVGLDEDTATNVLKEAMQGKEKSEFIDADSYNDIVKFKNFEVQREYAKAYGKKLQTAQTSINNAREQSAIRYADTQKAINEYQKQGMSASAIRELINAKFKPSADEIDYTRAYNDGVDVDARLAGQGIFYALEKDIAAQAYTPENYAVRLKQKRFGDERVQAFTQAYVSKDINIAKEYVNEKVADAYESRVQREVADEIKAKNEVEDVGLAIRDGEAIDKPEIYEGNNIMDFSSKIDDNFLRENATELEPSGNLFDFLAKTKNNPSRDKILNHFADKAGEGDSRLLEHRMAYLNYIMPTIKEPLIKIFRSDGRISNIKPFVFTDANSKTKNVNFLSIVTDKEGNIDFITAYALKDKSQLRSEIKKGIKVEVRRGLARTFDPHSRIQVPNATKNIIPQKGNLINEEAKNSTLPNGVSSIGDNASRAGGRQGGDEEILRQSGRNTADASEEKWTAKSDRQMEQRPAFKGDGKSDAAAASKQMVEKQGRDDEKVGDSFSHFTIDDVINKKLNFINKNNLGKKGWLDDLNLVIKKYGLKDKETKNKFMSVMIRDKFKYNREFHHSELKDVMPRISPLNPKYPEISNNAYKELNEIIKNKTIPATKEQNLRFFEEDANGVSEDALHLHAGTKPAVATGAKEINAKTINANSHIASGLVGGTLNSIDEDGSFNPEKFAAGFIAGLAGSKAVAIAARKITPQLYNKILGAAKKMPQMAKDNPKLLGKLYANGKDVSLNSFAGEKAITANVGKLDQAKAMLEKGADEVEIWQKTGWFKDKDGAWKFEIGDSKARLNPNFKSGGRLSELLEHEELFKAYPELKDIKIKKISDEGGEKLGYYDPNKKEIAINNIGDKSTLMHEVQHAIQDIEGFASGGEYDIVWNAAVRTIEKKYENELAKLEKIANEAWKKEEPLQKAYIELFDKGLKDSPEAQRLLKEREPYSKKGWEARNKIRNIKWAIEDEKNAITDKDMYEAYQKIHGEVEARNVQNRLNLDDAAGTHPYETFDINPNETFVSREDGISFSVKDALQKERRGVYNVAFNEKKSTIIRKDLDAIDEIIKFEKGEADYVVNGERKSGYGALHIKKHLDTQNNGWVSKQEYLDMGQMLRKSTMQEADDKRIYTYFNDDGVRFRVVVGTGKNKERIISFYSNRKPLKAGLSYDSQNYNGNLPLNGDKVGIDNDSLTYNYADSVQGSAAKSPIEHSSDGKGIIQQNEEKVYHSRKIEEIKQEHPNVEKELDDSIAAMRKESFNDVNFKDDLISKINAKEITTKQLGKSADLSDKQLAVLKNDIKNADFKVISDSKIYFDKMGRDGDKKRFFIDIAEDGKVRVDGYSKKGIDTIPVRQSALEELAGVGDRARLKNMSFEVKAAYFNELDPIKKEAILKTAELNKLKKAAQSGDKVAVAKFEEFKARNLDENGNIKDGLSLC